VGSSINSSCEWLLDGTRVDFLSAGTTGGGGGGSCRFLDWFLWCASVHLLSFPFVDRDVIGGG